MLWASCLERILFFAFGRPLPLPQLFHIVIPSGQDALPSKRAQIVQNCLVKIPGFFIQAVA